MKNSNIGRKTAPIKRSGKTPNNEISLKEEIEKLKYYLDSIPAPTHVVDKNYNICYINKKAAELLSMTQEECLGKKCFELFRTSHCRTDKCVVSRAIIENKEFTSENTIDPSGINLPIQYTGVPLKDEKGNITGALEHITDISDLKEIMNNLGMQKSYLDKLPAPVHIVDKNFNIQYINNSAAEILNTTVSECIGKKCYDLLKTPHCRTSECRMRHALTDDRASTGETVINSGGINLPIQYTSIPIKNSGNEIVGGLEHATVITDLREAMDDINIQNWMQNGIGELNEKMRGDQDIKTLAGNIISTLVKFLKANIGTFYVLNNESGTLELIGSYAYTSEGNNTIKIGEGLVGQAAEGKDIIAIEETPKGYLKIKSSLGDVDTGSILIVPYFFENELLGVFEIASLSKFTDKEINYLKSAVESIGIAVNSAVQRVKLKQLLEETQAQSEELQAQQEELRAANEELEEKNQVLQEAEEKLKAQQEELEASYEEMEEKTSELERQRAEFERNKKL